MAKKIVPCEIPTLNLLSKAPYQHTDSNLDVALGALKPVSILKGLGFKKRSGDTIEAIFYAILLMPLLGGRSIRFLFDNHLNSLLKGGKDTVYSFLENQSINWSLLTLKVAHSLFKLRNWDKSTDNKSAFIADDTLKECYGKKVEATSLHYDHNRGSNIKGHQVLQLGLSNSYGFLPLLAHIFVGKKKGPNFRKVLPINVKQ